ncbi:3-oxoacyl-(Acyl-carrier-protein) reductase [uncultured Desulfobacterium sp.]|uniref:3-oxoacyl-(Acyl-carrier-protein) reductase n=1 Tax=uncultured Desulfobacterium sp. TaxID=201089 RepID=A0A445N1D5_9BACT|nr:3-oxoacyl-(Acyl-carrier-protein) reductase [uncultured Desulfobacterium sp.]
MSLEKKIIVVTGAASGIGAETAKTLKAQGATVIGVDINEPKNVDQYIKADLGDPASIVAAVEKIPNGIDALCNIAGLPPSKGRVPVIKVNFLGLRHFTEQLINKMNNNASIVNLASLAGSGWPEAGNQIRPFLTLRDFNGVEALCNEVGIDDERAYSFSKEVVIVWTMINRWTWRDRGIRVNCISPGPVETPILPDFLENFKDKLEKDKDVMDRFGRPDDIAPVVAFMCSDSSAWIKGVNIPCDAGMTAHVLTQMFGYADAAGF